MPTIEGYKIGRCLGQGGMGAVYEGDQESTGRRVAIKLMLDSALVSETGRKRFEREVEVVARLNHPGIVSVVDSGVRKGQYYYVMEHVEGRPLDLELSPGWCDPKQALAIIAEVCDAVDYAHQRAVLHRDLKPGNIMIDARGRARLLDFGIAQLIEDQSKPTARETISRPGQIVGTVAYMAPEQAAGSNDKMSVRTDVYALGAIAYELLTRSLPCSVEGPLVEVLNNIAEVEPARPSSIRAGLSRDIDAVVLKALEKDPARRYATAGEFAADIRRFLAGEPVLARPVGPAGRAWRWAKRNRALAVVGATSVVVLVVVSAGLITRIVQERDRAVQNFTQLKKVLENADPEIEGGASIPQLMDTASKGLDKTPPASPQSEADIREIIGTVNRKFANYDSAIVNQRRVLAIREADAIGDDPLVADALHNLAATLWWDGKYADAEKLYIRALEMRQRLFKADDPAIALSMTHLAGCRLRLGRIESARTLYQGALEMRKRLYGPEHEQVAGSLNNIAKCELEADEFATAEASFRTALAMVKKLKGEKYAGTAAASANLADCILRRAEADHMDGQNDRARERAQEALSLFQSSLDVRTAMYPSGHPLTAATLGGMARASLALGNQQDAATYAANGLAMMLRKRPDHPDVVDLIEISAQVAGNAGDTPRARAMLQQAIDISSGVKPPAKVRTAQLRSELGALLVRAGDADAGLAMLRESGDLIEAERPGSLQSRIAQQRIKDAESAPQGQPTTSGK